MISLKSRDFYHQNIRYSFRWNIGHFNSKFGTLFANRQLFSKLEGYFNKISEGKIPNDIFNSRENFRVSNFKIKGIRSDLIRSFSKKLIREGKIKLLSTDSKLPTYVRSVYNNYRKDLNKTPGHDPVLRNILINDKDSIAIETPIWKRYENKFLTGHIDLIQITNNSIKIVDYKPEGKFLNSLPQVSMYGLLLKKIFKIDKAKCISFNKNKGWEYDPEILKEDIQDFLSIRIKERCSWQDFLN